MAKAADFPAGFSWLNATKPLSLDDLKGQVVVLDFWTYCCINCMHTLPTLEWIEEKYRGQPVVVIGVHSAKFDNEQQAENIQEAVGRYEISHPVIVDREMKIWRSYGVTAWPTVIVIDPKGNVVYHQAGEAQRDELDDVIGILLERHRQLGTLATAPIAIAGRKKAAPGALSYPGKLALSPDGKMIALSDSNHNCIVVADMQTGKISLKIGGPSRGLQDGGFEQARFFRPQGLAWVGDRIYVADTYNHAIRLVDLDSQQVSTLVGGKKSMCRLDDPACDTLGFYEPSDVKQQGNTLYIADTNSHLVRTFDLEKMILGTLAVQE